MKKILVILASLVLTSSAIAIAVVSSNDSIYATQKIEITKDDATTAVSSVLGTQADTVENLQVKIDADLALVTGSVLKDAGIVSATVSADQTTPTSASVALVADNTHVLAADANPVVIENIIKIAEVKTPVIGSITDQTVIIGTPLELTLSVENGVDGSVFSAVSASTNIATVSVDGTKLTITGVAAGNSQITVSYPNATDVSFIITVTEPVKTEITANDAKKVFSSVVYGARTGDFERTISSDLSKDNSSLKAAGIASATIESFDSSAKIIIITPTADDTHVLASDATEIELNWFPIALVSDGIKYEVINLPNIEAVNEKLKEYVTGGKHAYTGIEKMTAQRVGTSNKVEVRAEATPGYILSNFTFQIANALQPEKTEITKDVATKAVLSVLGTEPDTVENLQAKIDTDLNKSDSVLKSAGIASATVSADQTTPTSASIVLVADDKHKLQNDVDTIVIENMIKTEEVKTPVIGSIADQTVTIGTPLELTLSVENGVDGSVFSAVSASTDIATAVVDGTKLTITGVATGTSDITISYNNAKSISFTVTVS